MTELAPCTSCKRHVAIGEVTCPFCAAALPPLRAQRFVPRSFARAAVFSAAIAGCSDPKPAAAPTGSAAGSSEDLEKLLDEHDKVEHAAAPVDAGTPDAIEVASVDAGAPDAGVDEHALAVKRRQDAERRRDHERRERERKVKVQIMNKPYGAPPARRRLV